MGTPSMPLLLSPLPRQSVGPLIESFKIHLTSPNRLPLKLHREAVGAAVRPNPSFKRSTNGRPPSPGWWYAVHFHQPGLGVLPSAPA